jgi:hypothetical protein
MRPAPPNEGSPPINPHRSSFTQQQPDGTAQSSIPNNSITSTNSTAYYSLTLELTSIRSSSSNSNDVGPTIRKVESSSNDGSIRLIATMSSPNVDGEQANLIAALLFEQIDQLSLSTTYRVDRVKITALQFSKEAIVGIQGFLSMFLQTIRHVSMKDMVLDQCTQDDVQSFVNLCNVFESCTLETLNLSDNIISSPIWRCWSAQVQLRQLILDYVGLDDDSLHELAQNFTFGDTLEELYVVLTKNIGPKGVIAASSILKNCRCVGSLRWAVKDAPPDALMPWRGLADMAQEMIKAHNVAPLLHLVMDGGTISEEDCGPTGIAGGLEHFTQLKSMKFRSIGLKDIGALHISYALSIAKPPLEIFDLSRNFVQSIGVSSIAGLCEIDNITTNLTYFSLERNNIDAEGAITVFEAFGMKASAKLDIRLDGNPFSFNKIAFTLSCRKAQIETDRDDMLNDAKGSGHRRRRDNISDVRALQDQVSMLREEKTILMQAFTVLGSSTRVIEGTRLLDRISTLEKFAFGQPQGITEFGNHFIHDMDSSMQHSSCDPPLRMEPPMTPNGTSRVVVNTLQQSSMNHTNPLRTPLPTYSKNKASNGTSGSIIGSSSNSNNNHGGNDYWSASPGNSHCSNNPKRKVPMIGSINEPPNMYQNSPGLGLGGYIKSNRLKQSISGSTGNNNNNNNNDYDEVSKAGQSRSGSASRGSRGTTPSKLR